MTKTRPIPFIEFRGFLEQLGFMEKAVPKGRVLYNPKEGMLLFRFYRDDELVHPRDLLRTRSFLDLRGIIEADDYDARLLQPSRPA